MSNRAPLVLTLLVAALATAACSDTVAPASGGAFLPPSFDEVVGDGELEGSSFGEDPLEAIEETMFSLAAARGAGVAPAGFVVPADYQYQFGTTNNRFPYAQHDMRYQQVFLGSELGGLQTISALCLRKDDRSGGQAQTQQLTIRMGPTEYDHTNLTTAFDDNYSGRSTEVFSGDVNIPANTVRGTVEDFNLCIEFAQPYRHRVGSNVIVEIINTSPTSRPHFADACTQLAGPSCTTRRAYALSATATVATGVFNNGLIMKFLGEARKVTSQTIPYDQVLFGCTEPIALTGSMHIVMTETVSASGNRHMLVHFQPQGISGTGLMSGTPYQATGVTQQSFSSHDPLPYTSTVVNNFRLIGRGPDNNRLVHENYHITVNANGEITAEHVNASYGCK
jgi:hypothetical protein